jgi:hypothetical protein
MSVHLLGALKDDPLFSSGPGSNSSSSSTASAVKIYQSAGFGPGSPTGIITMKCGDSNGYWMEKLMVIDVEWLLNGYLIP